MSNIEQEVYHDKVNAKFAELIYQKMATKRYGVEFCNKQDNKKWLIKKELLDLNALKDPCLLQCQQWTFGAPTVETVVTYIPCTGFISTTKIVVENETLCFNPILTPTFDNNVDYTENGTCNI